jgi:hypothetical protein
MASRWYNPATGQFTSRDTATVNPMPNEAYANPFAYVADDPMDSTDPTGHWGCGWCHKAVHADLHAAKAVDARHQNRRAQCAEGHRPCREGHCPWRG